MVVGVLLRRATPTLVRVVHRGTRALGGKPAVASPILLKTQEAADTPAGQEVGGVQITTRDKLAGYKVVKELGIVFGSDIRSVNIIKDVLVSIGGVLGGSSAYYTQLQHETAEHALHTMVHSAQELGANAVLRVRFEPNLVMNRLVFGVHSSSFCFGTAVCVVPDTAPQRTAYE